MKVNDKEQQLLLDPSEVLVINTERKILPFPAASKLHELGREKVAMTWGQLISLMDALRGVTELSPEKKKFYADTKLVFVDSITRILFLLKEELERQGISGRDMWAAYLKEFERFLMMWSTSGRFMVYTSLDDITTDIDRIDRKTAAAQGQMSGKVESYFEVCLHTSFNRMKEGGECYNFITNNDGQTSAKTPFNMFNLKTEKFIQNDLSHVLYRMYKYYDMEHHPDFIPPRVIIVGKSGSGKSTSLAYPLGDIK